MSRLKFLFVPIAIMLMIPFSAMASPSSHASPVSQEKALSGQCTYSFSEPAPFPQGWQIAASLNMNCSVSHTRTVQVCIIDPSQSWHCNDNTSYARYFNVSVFDSSVTNTGGVYYWYAWVYMHDVSNGDTWTQYSDGVWLHWKAFWV